MNMFNELNDTNEIIVPSDLETQVKGRIQRRVRKQRVVAALLSSVLVIAFSGVAYAVATGGNANNGNIKTVDQNKRDGVGVNDSTSTSIVDDTATSIIDDNGKTTIVTSKRSDDKNDDQSDDDVTVTSTVTSTDTNGSITSTSSPDDDDEDEIESENSGSGSGN